MTFDDHAFDFIPWAQPLSDPRKARITVKQLLNHTSAARPARQSLTRLEPSPDANGRTRRFRAVRHRA
jgi:CubicO group peptidase (beta-lactamase class C family)